MIYHDRIYGRFEIAESVILDLLGCPSMQRLRGVEQGGYERFLRPQYYHDRFEHSVGVYLLLARYGAPLSEQVAGLIHDVSHSVFSHAIDYALEGGSEAEHSYQDNIHNRFVMNSEIPDILKRRGFDPEFILEEKNFPLKENNLPDICADRLDYSLREMVIYQVVEPSKAAQFLKHLRAEKSKWFFGDYAHARSYAEIYLQLNSNWWSDFLTAVMFRAIGDLLKEALKSGFISHQDLYTTDSAVMEKINHHAKDPRIAPLLDRVEGRVKAIASEDRDAVKVTCKSRAVDPLFREGDKLRRVSDIDPKWGEVVRNNLRAKEYSIKFAN